MTAGREVPDEGPTHSYNDTMVWFDMFLQRACLAAGELFNVVHKGVVS